MYAVCCVGRLWFVDLAEPYDDAITRYTVSSIFHDSSPEYLRKLRIRLRSSSRMSEVKYPVWFRCFNSAISCGFVALRSLVADSMMISVEDYLEVNEPMSKLDLGSLVSSVVVAKVPTLAARRMSASVRLFLVVSWSMIDWSMLLIAARLDS